MPALGPDRQIEIYLRGAMPDRLPVSAEQWETRAREALDEGAFGYIAGSAGAGDTARANREAFYRWRICPRMLRGSDDRDLGTTLFGRGLDAPLLLGPVGVLSIAHADGDIPAAKAAAGTGVPFVASTVSSVPLETIAAAMGDAIRWFQLYPASDREISASFVRRAEAAGYSAIVVTVDTTILGWREQDLAAAYLPFLRLEGVANYLSDPVFRAGLTRPPEDDPQGTVMHWVRVFSSPRLGWSDLDGIRSMTKLPILVKGIVHPADAVEALERGVNGLIVSNHGGRQVDGAVAALDALPQVVDVVAGRVPILFDSGIRHGADVVKAIALGASAVLIGRPYVYGLAVGGENGVREVIRNLLAETDLQLALSGISRLRDVDRSLLVASAQ